jgi:hypothetical protein
MDNTVFQSMYAFCNQVKHIFILGHLSFLYGTKLSCSLVTCTRHYCHLDDATVH